MEQSQSSRPTKSFYNFIKKNNLFTDLVVENDSSIEDHVLLIVVAPSSKWPRYRKTKVADRSMKTSKRIVIRELANFATKQDYDPSSILHVESRRDTSIPKDEIALVLHVRDKDVANFLSDEIEIKTTYGMIKITNPHKPTFHVVRCSGIHPAMADDRVLSVLKPLGEVERLERDKKQWTARIFFLSITSQMALWHLRPLSEKNKADCWKLYSEGSSVPCERCGLKWHHCQFCPFSDEELSFFQEEDENERKSNETDSDGISNADEADNGDVDGEKSPPMDAQVSAEKSAENDDVDNPVSNESDSSDDEVVINKLKSEKNNNGKKKKNYNNNTKKSCNKSTSNKKSLNYLCSFNLDSSVVIRSKKADGERIT